MCFVNFLILIFSVCRFTSTFKLDDHGSVARSSEKLFNLLQDKLLGWTVTMLENNKIAIESVNICVETESNDNQKTVLVSWTNQDEDLGAYILGLLQNMG